MSKTGKILAIAALLAIPAGAAGAHAFSEHHHGHHHRHDSGPAWRAAADVPQQRFEVKINAIWCGPATAAAAPKWCGA